jgi:hypothetical protein
MMDVNIPVYRKAKRQGARDKGTREQGTRGTRDKGTRKAPGREDGKGESSSPSGQN